MLMRRNIEAEVWPHVREVSNVSLESNMEERRMSAGDLGFWIRYDNVDTNNLERAAAKLKDLGTEMRWRMDDRGGILICGYGPVLGRYILDTLIRYKCGIPELNRFVRFNFQFSEKNDLQSGFECYRFEWVPETTEHLGYWQPQKDINLPAFSLLYQPDMRGII